MTIRRLTAAAALGALLLIGAPATAAATTTECEPPGGLLGVSVDDCGIQVSLLGIDVGLGGSESGSGGETPDEPEPSPDDPPAAEEPPSDGGSGSGSGGGSGATSDPSAVAPSGSADVRTRSVAGPDGQVGGDRASGAAVGWSSAKPSRFESDVSERDPDGADEAAAGVSDPVGAAGPAGGGPSDGSGSGQLRGPLSNIPQGSPAVSGAPLASPGPVVVVALALVAAGVLSAVIAVSLSARKRLTRSAS